MKTKLKIRPKTKVKNKLLRQIHIYCSLICCTLLLVFALTGISLNHRELFESALDSRHYQLPLNEIAAEPINQQLNSVEVSLSPEQLALLVINKEFAVSSPGKRLDIYIEGDFLEIDMVNLGLVSQLNELHQNRYTSKLWRLVSDFRLWSLSSSLAREIGLVCVIEGNEKTI